MQPRVLPQPRRSIRRLSTVEATLDASTSSAGSSVNPPAIEETIEISSSEIEHSEKGSSSSDSNDDIPLGTLMKTRAEKREMETRKGKAKKQLT